MSLYSVERWLNHYVPHKCQRRSSPILWVPVCIVVIRLEDTQVCHVIKCLDTRVTIVIPTVKFFHKLLHNIPSLTGDWPVSIIRPSWESNN